MEKFTVDGPAAAANLVFERDRGADRRGRPGRARGARAGPGQPRPGRARGPPRPRRVGGSGRRRAAQGAPARPTTTPTRRSGTSSPGRPSTASASPRSVRRSCSTASSRWAGRPDRGRGTSGRTSLSPTPRRTTRRCSPTSRAGSRRCGSRSTRTPTGASCSTGCCSTSRRWSCRRPRPVPAPSCGTPTAASCTRAPTWASDAPARHPGPGRSGVADGRARLRGRRDRGPRPRRLRRPGARPLAGRRCARTCARLTDAGFDLDEAAKIVEFRYAATDEQFTTIAKLRAARRLWAPGPRAQRRPASASSTSTP